MIEISLKPRRVGRFVSQYIPFGCSLSTNREVIDHLFDSSVANSADLHLASSARDAASPVYHNRRDFRSTAFAALINGNREMSTTSPPPPPCKPLDGSILSEHNLAVLLLNYLYCCGYFLYMGYVDRQLLYLLSYCYCHDDSYCYGYYF